MTTPPYHLDETEAGIAQAWLFVKIRTSGQIYPAAGLDDMAAAPRIVTLEIGAEPARGRFDNRRIGLASEMVPAWVEAS